MIGIWRNKISRAAFQNRGEELTESKAVQKSSKIMTQIMTIGDTKLELLRHVQCYE